MIITDITYQICRRIAVDFEIAADQSASMEASVTPTVELDPLMYVVEVVGRKTDCTFVLTNG